MGDNLHSRVEDSQHVVCVFVARVPVQRILLISLFLVGMAALTKWVWELYGVKVDGWDEWGGFLSACDLCFFIFIFAVRYPGQWHW